MPWNPLLIGYLKQCLWLLIIHDDPWRVRFFPSLSANIAENQQVRKFPPKLPPKMVILGVNFALTFIHRRSSRVQYHKISLFPFQSIEASTGRPNSADDNSFVSFRLRHN